MNSLIVVLHNYDKWLHMHRKLHLDHELSTRCRFAELLSHSSDILEISFSSLPSIVSLPSCLKVQPGKSYSENKEVGVAL